MKGIITSSEREYGIDILRILAMFMVLILHILNAGGVLHNTEEYTGKWFVEYFFFVISMCAVDCYGIISGYLGIKANTQQYSRIVELWLKVVFYGVVITIIAKCVCPDSVSSLDILKAFLPITFNRAGYWYFTAYFGLYFLRPMLNKAILNMTKAEFSVVIVVSIVLFSVMDTLGAIYTTTRYLINGGHSLLWLIVLYLVGAFIQMFGKEMKSKKGVIFFLLGLVGTVVLRCILHFGGGMIGLSLSGSLFSVDNSPTILIEAIGLFLILRRIRISERLKRIVQTLSSSLFSVYIIHMHWCVFVLLLEGRFSALANLSVFLIPFVLIGVAGLLYMLCTVIDVLRVELYKILNVSTLTAKIDGICCRLLQEHEI